MKKSSSIIITRNLGQNVVSNYNGIDLNDTPNQKQAEMELAIADRIGFQLVKHYPNREWKVVVDITGRMIILACDSLSNDRGYYLPMDRSTMMELEKRAVKACGEILERFNISRNRNFNTDELETVERDFQGETIAPDANPENISKRVH